jgi:WD40 repeat protein
MAMGTKRNATLVVCLAVCFGSSLSPASAVPVYAQTAIIPVPAIAGNPTGAFSFDISFFDANTQLDYVADRPNASIDVFSAATNSFVSRIDGTGSNAFVGTVPSPDTGPNGVLVINQLGQRIVYGGDGDSTLKAFNVATGLPVSGSPIATGVPAQGRADEMAFDPANSLLLVANDHGTPAPFVSLINTNTNSVVKQITFDGTLGTPNATNGIEQPVWNSNTGRFYISVPRIGASPDPGGIAAIDPVAGTVTKVYDLSTFGISACNPTGLALGQGNQLMIGCSSNQSILFDPTANGGNGAVIKTFTQATGVDELTFDPTLGLFFLASSANGISVIDGFADTFLQQLSTGFAGSHSVSVDPVSHEVFVPVRNNALIPGCLTGCIEVFSTIPEPGTMPLVLGGVLTLIGLALRRQRLNVAHEKP